VSEKVVSVANVLVSTSWVSVLGVTAATDTPQVTPPVVPVSAYQPSRTVQLPVP
jgi:hypothetical protein